MVPESRLAELAASAEVLLRQNEPGPQSVGECLRAWLDGDGSLSLEAALCIDRLPGERKPQTVRRLEQRDKMLREIKRRFFGQLTDNAAADEIAKAISRYRAGADWRRDRTRDAVEYRQTLRGHAWAVLKVVDYAPAARTVRRHLAVR